MADLVEFLSILGTLPRVGECPKAFEITEGL